MVTLKYLNFADLRSKLGGRSRAAIYVDMNAGRFPKPLKLGRRLYWPEHIVDDYLMAIHEAGCNRG
jgi:predicted DNA-binding transcriptional regulator AlpA